MAGKERYSVERVIQALKDAKGMKGPAARALGCSWTAVDGYAKRHPSVQKVITEEREGTTDVAELALRAAILRGEAWAVCFYLKTQGKNRGYVERSELTGADGGAIQHELALAPAAVALLDEMAAAKRSQSQAKEARVFSHPN